MVGTTVPASRDGGAKQDRQKFAQLPQPRCRRCHCRPPGALTPRAVVHPPVLGLRVQPPELRPATSSQPAMQGPTPDATPCIFAEVCRGLDYRRSLPLSLLLGCPSSCSLPGWAGFSSGAWVPAGGRSPRGGSAFWSLAAAHREPTAPPAGHMWEYATPAEGQADKDRKAQSATRREVDW